jgi:hypothetical protein
MFLQTTTIFPDRIKLPSLKNWNEAFLHYRWFQGKLANEEKILRTHLFEIISNNEVVGKILLHETINSVSERYFSQCRIDSYLPRQWVMAISHTAINTYIFQNYWSTIHSDSLSLNNDSLSLWQYFVQRGEAEFLGINFTDNMELPMPVFRMLPPILVMWFILIKNTWLSI